MRDQDSGVGIPAEAIGHIFDKFYQGDISRAIVGNGLGLALAREIVQLHEGEIVADSTEGQGTRFTVTLPAVK